MISSNPRIPIQHTKLQLHYTTLYAPSGSKVENLIIPSIANLDITEKEAVVPSLLRCHVFPAVDVVVEEVVEKVVVLVLVLAIVIKIVIVTLHNTTQHYTTLTLRHTLAIICHIIITTFNIINKILTLTRKIWIIPHGYSCSGGSGRGRCGEQSSVLLYYYRIVYICCIGALIILILNSLHHEVVRCISLVSSNPPIPIQTQTLQVQLHYTTIHLPAGLLIVLIGGCESESGSGTNE